MRITYRIHNFEEIFRVGVILDGQEFLEFGNKAKDRLVCDNDTFFYFLCPTGRYATSEIKIERIH